MGAVYRHNYEEPERVASVGDVVMGPGNVRAIVIAMDGTFVKLLAIGTKLETGETFVLTPRWIRDVPASECLYLPKQMLTL